MKKKLSLMLSIIMLLQIFSPMVTNICQVNLGVKAAEEIPESSTSSEQSNNVVTEEVKNSEISEAYLEWEQLSDEEKKSAVEPREEKININELEQNEYFVALAAPLSEIPSEYDLRDEIGDIKIENQGTGNCYAYATLNAVETNIALKTGTMYDFSEMHVEYMTSTLLEGTREFGIGGNFETVIDYSKDLFGPVTEEEIPNTNYAESEYYKLREASPIVTINETIDFPTINKSWFTYSDQDLEEFRDTVKNHIMENGSVYASIYFDETVYNPQTYAYCTFNKSAIMNHAVTIIGWDDTYSKQNFKEGNRPSKDGAWIAINSWGNNWGNNGVFYISYEDVWAEYNMSGIVSTTEFVDSYGPKAKFSNYTIKDTSISSTVNVYDVGGNALGNIYYQWTQSTDIPEVNTFTETFQNGQTLEKTFNSNENYYLWILAYDSLGNYSITGPTELVFSDEYFYNALCEEFSYKIIENRRNDDNTYSIFMANDSINEIEVMDISHKNISNISGIEQFKNLKELSLFGNKITSIDNISFPKELEKLELGENSIEKITEDTILPTELKYLRLAYNENLTEFSAILPDTLEKVDFEKCYSINTWDKIFLPNGLKYLNLAKCEIGNINIIRFPDSITELYLGENNLSDISSLNNLTNLEYLDIGANAISDISVIENMTALKTFRASETVWNESIGQKGSQCNKIENISNIEWPKQLEYLDLSDNKITNIIGIDWPESLQYLHLENNLISEIGNFETWDNLISLGLEYNQIEDISTLYINGNPNIRREIRLDGNNITDISNIEWKNSKVYGIRLSNNRISSIDNVEWPEELAYLDLSNNNISSITNSLFNSNLISLTLDGNKIESINNVNWPNRIEKISLNSNKIKNVENDLSSLTALRSLYLDNNYIENITPVEDLNLNEFSIKNQSIIKVINDNSENIELPQIMKASKTSGSKVYSSDALIEMKCEIQNGNVTYNSQNLGSIYIKINGGNADGTIMYITNTEVDEIGEVIYKIETKEELVKFRDIVNSSSNDVTDITIKLMNDIDLGGYYNEQSGNWEGEQWIPIGDENHPFNCTFDGNEYKISGIYINTDKDYQGFIGYNKGNIKNLGIESGYIFSTGDYIGGISGYNDNWYDHSGDGIINIINCYNKASVIGNGYVGGISGYNHSTNNNCQIINCYNEGNILGDYYVAGIVGAIRCGSIIDRSYNLGDITSRSKSAGIAGDVDNWLSSVRISNCFNRGTITNTSYSVGGIVADFSCESNEDVVENCYNIGAIIWNQKTYSGEIVGDNNYGSTIKNCYYKNQSEIKAINGADDETNNVYGLTDEYMKSTEFVNLLNTGNNESVWKIGDSTYPYPILKSDEEIIVAVLKGDANGDNQVNFRDILVINNHRLGKTQLTGDNLIAADVTGDGIIDFRDILQVNRYRLGKIDSL